ncbi:MAG: hypothetical protein KAT58_11965 [candidate division Zixibacteria bacterium]|nr:hypothetical protein [candidate division Zixibacteria bacterium]
MNYHCRKTQSEIDRDVAHRLDEEQGLTDTAEQVIADRVEELLDPDSTDEDSMVVLMEDPDFIAALRPILGHYVVKNPSGLSMISRQVNDLLIVADEVMTKYVESQS